MATYDVNAALSKLDRETREKLAAHGFSADRLERLAATLRESREGAEARRDARNRVAHADAPAAHEIGDAPNRMDARLRGLGLDALRAGKLAFCVMAGGMATRMGGVVKALVEATDGMSFLDIRLRENDLACKRAGRVVPLWLMTSDATDSAIRAELRKKNSPPHVRTFVQELSLRLTETGELFFDDHGHASTYAPGHGDLPDALIRSGYLDEHIAAGGEYVWITNVDNLGASIDDALLGFFPRRTPSSWRRSPRKKTIAAASPSTRMESFKCSKNSVCQRISMRASYAFSTRILFWRMPARCAMRKSIGHFSKCRKKSTEGPRCNSNGSFKSSRRR